MEEGGKGKETLLVRDIVAEKHSIGVAQHLLFEGRVADILDREIDHTVETVGRVDHVHLLLIRVHNGRLIFVEETRTVNEAICEGCLARLLLANECNFKTCLPRRVARQHGYIALRPWINKVCVAGEECGVPSGTHIPDHARSEGGSVPS